ncbi:hypothetical protein QYM36_017661 [Artemia franciscana]|uniref:HAT C-terminal dimerisation domain-containing protein n=1 Tax=Artemia franciscana TaxID=6661 RepID=A0AA88HAQ0_ARTSF|nr:hypothetical protein QYM36_017661 [Artemia franciscana]
MKDDPELKDIFEKSAGNAQYCSPRIQYELIDIYETKDISRQEQIALGLQFVDSKKLQIREEFIEFAVVEDLRGKSLGQFILSQIEKLGLDMKLYQLIQSLESRFAKHKVTLKGLSGILPSFVVKQPCSDLTELIKLYASDLTSTDSTVMAELELWRAKWQKVVTSLFPKTAVQSLAECERGIFPNVHKLLSIFCVVPTSTACVERSFSSMKRIKTYLHSRMSEDRLNGLALLNFHRDVLVSVDEIWRNLLLALLKDYDLNAKSQRQVPDDIRYFAKLSGADSVPLEF